ncbi:hypothetical protein [Sulfuriroseicoccus oceanibius]|uniref:Uncharacterized protein n=1 Tax=Sulfuriroseicoccus oceanibius TaxID=2707525 RepID=A0A6B3LG76_9BACT|nr:hypothetical protein [Sulfuriroseicoccus oceanibius]QQL44609.1 hypothetical protein G3M56_012060 [Sulfuriroseicoccus oceanibius]
MLVVELIHWLFIPFVAWGVIKRGKAVRPRDGKKLEICAASSAAMLILNSDLWSLLLWNVFGIPYSGFWGGSGSSELLSFGYSFVIVVLSIVGIRRIRRNAGGLYGFSYAVPGLILGLGIVCFWLWIGSMFFFGLDLIIPTWNRSHLPAEQVGAANRDKAGGCSQDH